MKQPSTTDLGHVCVARQPILDGGRRVFGYDLAFHTLNAEEETPVAGEYATARLISDGVLAIGLDTLVDTRRAFVNVGRQLLLEGIPSVLPADRVIVELSADVEAEADVVAACEQLRRAGYALSVDGFVLNEWTADLVPLASFLKVDVRTEAGRDTAARLTTAGSAGGAALIATNVETPDLFQDAAARGFQYFQGYFFGKPVMLEGRELPTSKLTNLRLLQALNKPDLSVHHIEEIIKPDAALCYRILRTVNSAAYALQRTVQSIREALVLLGRDPIRRWASVWALAGLNEQAHSELVVMSTVRARCCELLAASRGDEDAAAEGFLVGMCSMLDAILSRPMATILEDLPLAPASRAALLGEDNPMRRILDCAIAYERGEWDRCTGLAKQAGIKLTVLPGAYAEALRWSKELQRN
jgi:EAL and modified HD-GYP domain-containing signal transduction protein